MFVHLADGFRLLRVVLLGGALLLLAMLPADVLARLPSVCLFKNLFDTECAGCGMTRALSSALHLDFASARSHNRLVVVVLPLLIAMLYADVSRLARRRGKG